MDVCGVVGCGGLVCVYCVEYGCGEFVCGCMVYCVDCVVVWYCGVESCGG